METAPTYVGGRTRRSHPPLPRHKHIPELLEPPMVLGSMRRKRAPRKDGSIPLKSCALRCRREMQLRVPVQMTGLHAFARASKDDAKPETRKSGAFDRACKLEHRRCAAGEIMQSTKVARKWGSSPHR